MSFANNNFLYVSFQCQADPSSLLSTNNQKASEGSWIFYETKESSPGTTYKKLEINHNVTHHESKKYIINYCSLHIDPCFEITGTVRDPSQTLVREVWWKKWALIFLIGGGDLQKIYKFSSEDWAYIWFFNRIDPYFSWQKGGPKIEVWEGYLKFFALPLPFICIKPPHKCLWMVP